MISAYAIRRCGVVLLVALMLSGCGGGGDSAEAALEALTPAQRAEMAFVAKVAGIAHAVTSNALNNRTSPIAVAEGELWLHALSAAPLETCTSDFRKNIGTDPPGMGLRAVNQSCNYSRDANGMGGGTLQFYRTVKQSLVGLSASEPGSNLATQFEERIERQGSSAYKFKLQNGLPLDGKLSWNWSTLRRAELQPDGSGRDRTHHVIAASETSPRGNSNYAVNAMVDCSFALIAGNLGSRCAHRTSRLTGAVYGQAIDAAIATDADSAGSYTVDYGAGRMTVTLESATGGTLRWRYRVKTTSGLDFVMLGEDLSWLSAF